MSGGLWNNVLIDSNEKRNPIQSNSALTYLFKLINDIFYKRDFVLANTRNRKKQVEGTMISITSEIPLVAGPSYRAGFNCSLISMHDFVCMQPGNYANTLLY